MSHNLKSVIVGMNWELLREQKLALQTLLESVLHNPNLEGLITLIDNIQDAAVDDGMFTEFQVFGDLHQAETFGELPV